MMGERAEDILIYPPFAASLGFVGCLLREQLTVDFRRGTQVFPFEEALKPCFINK